MAAGAVFVIFLILNYFNSIVRSCNKEIIAQDKIATDDRFSKLNEDYQSSSSSTAITLPGQKYPPSMWLFFMSGSSETYSNLGSGMYKILIDLDLHDYWNNPVMAFTNIPQRYATSLSLKDFTDLPFLWGQKPNAFVIFNSPDEPSLSGSITINDVQAFSKTQVLVTFSVLSKERISQFNNHFNTLAGTQRIQMFVDNNYLVARNMYEKFITSTVESPLERERVNYIFNKQRG